MQVVFRSKIESRLYYCKREQNHLYWLQWKPSGWTNECETWTSNVSFDIHDDDKDIYGESKTKPEVLHAETNAIAKVLRSYESAVDSCSFIKTTLPRLSQVDLSIWCQRVLKWV
ncbi:MAG: hypothetical protein CM15mP106_7210 [Candidatus Neomarinimicrobiota bacterium]|nr:MAG: hypothetical protein CM15mP106_7210 [Candidatus Neomarinimicrobiota bacterium]